MNSDFIDFIDRLSRSDEFKENPSCYIYDLDVVDRQLRQLESLPLNANVYYAMKANPNVSLLNYLAQKEVIAGVEIASIGELRKGVPVFGPCRVIFTGPGKTMHELEQSALAGIKQINIESYTEAIKLDSIIRDKKLGPINALVRVNVDYQNNTAHTRMAGKSSKLGIDEEVILQEYSKICQLEGLNVRGIHVFAASGMLESEEILGYFNHIFRLSLKLRENGFPQQCVDLGGGFGIDYTGKKRMLDVRAVGDGLETLIRKNNFQEKEIMLELGRYIIGEAGYYVTEIQDIKMSKGKIHVITAGGINHQRRPCAVETNHPIEVVQRDSPALYEGQLVVSDKRVDVGGPLCLTEDILGKDVHIANTKIGDLIVVRNSGAYGYSMAALDFLGHPHPKEYFIKRGKLIE